MIGVLIFYSATNSFPEVIQNNNIDVEYVSPLAKAQRNGDIQSLVRLFELITPIAQVDPGVMDYLDTDGMAKHLIRTVGIPASAVRGTEEVEQMRREKAQQEQAAQEMMQAQQSAEAAGQAAPMVKALGGQEGIAQLLGGEGEAA